jgi:hypothetical protein
LKAKGWIDRGVRNLPDVEPPAKVHVVEDDRTLCGAPRSDHEISRDGYQGSRFKVHVCDQCDDVIWGMRAKA